MLLSDNPYVRLFRFIFPLAITAIVFELGSQVLNAGMARVPQATQTLAAFGLGWGLVLFLASPLSQTKELGLVLATDQTAMRTVRRFVIGFGALLSLLLATLSLTPFSHVVIEQLHGVDETLAAIVRTALFWLIPYPLIKGLAQFHAGLLLRVRRTAHISYATLSNLAVSIATVFALLSMPFIHSQPILLPVLAVYAGMLVELTLMVYGCVRYVFPRLRQGGEPGAPGSQAMGRTTSKGPVAFTALGYGDIVRFFWPLSLIMIIQEMSRPLINLFIARGPDATESLAILAVLYTLGRIPYGWLNEVRNLAAAFRDEHGGMQYIRRFAVACGAVSFAMMVILFWTPLRTVILESWIGVSPELAERGRVPLYLFSLFSFVVMGRAYYHGVALVERRTHVIAPSAPARILAILGSLVGLPHVGITGATLGILALWSGFFAEMIVVWWGVRGHALLTRRAERFA